MSGIREELKKWFLDVRESDVKVEEIIEEPIDVMPEINAYIFVDLDNTGYAEIGDLSKLDEHIEINLYADRQHKPMLESNQMNRKIKNCPSHIKKVTSNVGPNSTDFKIICDAATALAKPGVEYIYIVSKDQDYNEAIDHLRMMYSHKVKAIEKFQTVEECIDDMNLMKSTNKEEFKSRLIKQFFRPYRSDAINELLDLLER